MWTHLLRCLFGESKLVGPKHDDIALDASSTERHPYEEPGERKALQTHRLRVEYT